MTKRLKPTRACLEPLAAGRLRVRHEEWQATKVLPWSDDWHNIIIFEYRRLLRGNRQEGYAGWKHIPGRSDDWDRAKRVDMGNGRWCYEGRCGDFVPELLRRLQGRNIPGACLAPVICTIATSEPHMVLAVHTSKGTLICCHLAGCWPWQDKEFSLYTWEAIQNPDGSWGDFNTGTVGTLESLIG